MQRYRVVIMLVLFGVVPVVAAFFVALSFLGQQEVEAPPAAVEPLADAEPPPPETSTVLAAARDLPVGTLVGGGDLSEIELEVSAIESEHVLVDNDSNVRTYRGYAVRTALSSGMPLTRSALIGPGQKGFLAAVLRPGARAVTVRVGSATGQAGLIDPGDRVDVILSAELEVDEQELTVFARTIVEDVRVVAVDHRLNGEDPERPEVITATLEVSPPDGDRLVLAEHEGSLSLAVRSLVAVAGQPRSEAVALREVLLASEPDALDANALRELEDRLLAEMMASEDRLWDAIEAGDAAATPEPVLDTVRIYRGVEPAQEVTFERPSPAPR